MAKIIMHIDLNAFFASAEVLRDPSLKGKPLAVAGMGRRGVVSTASYEARKFGVHSAMPTFEAIAKCPNLIIKQGDYSYYEMLSNSFFSYLRKYSKIIEPASIDEGFVDLTEQLRNSHDPYGYLNEIQQGLLKEIGLPCSIGLAPTKFLAKMASDMKKPMGITILRRKDMPHLLYPLPIASCFGVGKKTAPKLEELGIKTIGDFAALCKNDDPRLTSHLGKFYLTLKEWVLGRGSDEVITEAEDAKSLSHSVTLSSDTSDYEEIVGRIKELSEEVASGAKRERKHGKTVNLVIKDTEFKVHDKSITFLDPTNDGAEICSKAIELYTKNFLGMTIRLVGVGLSSFVDMNKENIQMSLWNYPKYEEMDKTKLLVNELNRKMEKPILKLGSEVKKNEDK